MFPILVTINNAEQFEAVKAALSGNVAPAKATRASKAVAAATETLAAAATPVVAAAAAPAAAPAAPVSTVTLQEVVKLVTDKAKTHRADVVAILAANGAGKASELKAEKYEAFATALRAIGSEAAASDGLL